MIAPFEHSRAIVIGIDRYQDSRALRTAVNDARRLANSLRKDHGYNDVVLLEDANRATLVTELGERLKERVGEDDRLLLYFAGHGCALDSDDGPEGFLIPADARADDRTTFVNMADLYAWLDALPCRHLLVILDCCFAGSFTWYGRRHMAPIGEVLYREHYDRFIREPAWQILTSAAHDQEALDVLAGRPIGERGALTIDGASHSPFANALFAALQGEGDLIPKGQGDGVITATELYLYLRQVVEVDAEEQAKHPQTPELWPFSRARHGKGEFIFLVSGHGEPDLPPAPELTPENNPYRGLKSYEESHAPLFFGRETLVKKLADAVDSQPLTIVLGASGTGKSSVVKAGLIPHLKQRTEKDLGHNADRKETPYTYTILPPIRPGDAPLRVLTESVTTNFPESSEIAGRSAPETFIPDALEHWLTAHPDQRLLLVVDQAEELLTVSRDEGASRAFLQTLANLLATHADRLRIIFTLRTDFEPQFQDSPLTSQWRQGRFIVPPMDQAELRKVIENPAAVRVLFFDPPDLVDALINEVILTPGALPLLSFTLEQLYLKYIERQSQAQRNGVTLERALTQADYTDLGGVIGSLRRCADNVYVNLPDDAHRATMQRVMLRMVSVEGSELARRRVMLSELEYPVVEENTRVQTVLSRLVAARLLVMGSNNPNKDGPDDPTVEPAHDALVVAWDKLLHWKRQAEEYLPMQRRLALAAEEWDYASDRKMKTKLLWNSDPRLPQVHQVVAPQDYMGIHSLNLWSPLRRTLFPSLSVSHKLTWLNSREIEFLQASIRRRAQLAWQVAAVTILVGIVLLSVALIAWNQRILALQERDNTLINEAQRVANIALQGLSSDPMQSMLQSLSVLPSTIQPRPYVPEVENALTQAIQVNQLRQQIPIEARADNQVAFGPHLIAVGGPSLSLITRPPETPLFAIGHKLAGVPKPVELLDKEINWVQWAPNNDLLSIEQGKLRVWRNGKQIAEQTVDESFYVHCVEWSPTSEAVALCSDDQVWIWGVISHTLNYVNMPSFVNSIRWSRDGERIAVVTDNMVVIQPTLAVGDVSIIEASEDEILDALFVDSEKVITWGFDGTVRLSSTTGEPLALFADPENYRHIRGVVLDTNHTRIAAFREDGTINVWRLDDPVSRPLALQGHGGMGITAVAWHDEYLASAGVDGTVHLWDLTTGELLTRLSGHGQRIYQLDWQEDERSLLSYGRDGTLRLWQVLDATGDPICRLNSSTGAAYCTTLARDQLRLDNLHAVVRWTDGERVLVVTDKGEILDWSVGDRPSGVPTQLITEQRSLLIDETGSYIFLYVEHASGELWRRDQGSWVLVQTIERPIAQAFWSGSRLILTEPAGNFHVVDAATGLSQTLTTNTSTQILRVSISGERMAVSYTDGSLRVFDFAGNRLLFEVVNVESTPYSSLSWSNDGESLLMQSAYIGTVSLLDAKSGRYVWSHTPTSSGFNFLAPVFSPSEEYIAFTSDSTVYVLDAKDGSLVLSHPQATGNLLGLTWNRDGTRLLTWDESGAIRLWHWDETASSMVQILELRAGESIHNVAINADESNLVTISNDNMIRVWQVWPNLERLLATVHDCCVIK